MCPAVTSQKQMAQPLQSIEINTSPVWPYLCFPAAVTGDNRKQRLILIGRRRPPCPRTRALTGWNLDRSRRDSIRQIRPFRLYLKLFHFFLLAATAAVHFGDACHTFKPEGILDLWQWILCQCVSAEPPVLMIQRPKAFLINGSTQWCFSYFCVFHHRGAFYGRFWHGSVSRYIVCQIFLYILNNVSNFLNGVLRAAFYYLTQVHKRCY